MLIKVIENLKSTNIFSRPYKGVVVENKDPKQLRRVKVSVPGLVEGTVDELPWFHIQSSAGLGGGTDHRIPNIDSEVIVEFPFEDIYTGFVTGFWQSSATAAGRFNEDYPDSWGVDDGSGTYFQVNRAKNFAELQHSSGSKIRMNADGSIELVSRTKIGFSSEDGKTNLDFDMNTGEIELSPKGTLSLQPNNLKIDTPEVNTTTGSKRETINGGETSEVVGGYKKVIGGSESRSIVGSKAESIAGGSSLLVGSKSEATYGLGKEETIVAGGILQKLLLGSVDVQMLLGNYSVSLTAGNYSVDVVAGNVSVKTVVGNFEIGNALGNISVDLTGSIKIMAALSLDMQAGVSASILAPTIKFGLGLAPIVTILSDPLEDMITGKPKMGVPTITAG